LPLREPSHWVTGLRPHALLGSRWRVVHPLSDPFGLCLPKDDTPCPLAFGGFTGSLVFGVGIDVAFGFTVDETDGVGVYGSIGLRGV
jgi:hypothetical protein